MVVNRPVKFEVALRGKINQHKFVMAQQADSADMRQRGFLRFLNILQQRAGGGQAGRGFLHAESGEGMHLKMLKQSFPRRAELKRPIWIRRDAGGLVIGQDALLLSLRRIDVAFRHDDLFRLKTLQFIQQLLKARRAGEFAEMKFTRRKVKQSDADELIFRRFFAEHGGREDGGDEIILLRVENRRVQNGAGRDDAHDFALDNAFRGARVFDLLADGDAEALPNHARQVGVNGMIRHAAERDAGRRRAAVPRSQRDLQGFRGDFSVLEKHFVKIPHAEKEDRVGVFRLNPAVLLQKRGRFGHE